MIFYILFVANYNLIAYKSLVHHYKNVVVCYDDKKRSIHPLFLSKVSLLLSCVFFSPALLCESIPSSTGGGGSGGGSSSSSKINSSSGSSEHQPIRKESKLVSYIGDFTRQLEYLFKLINNISVQTLTQENVSCLNTTLVFLMFANKRRQLPKYLQALRDEQGDDALNTVNASILQNFRELLLFWQDHYLHKDKDCSALEKSSKISFAYWKMTVSMLVSDNKTSPTAVCYYIDPLPSDRTN